MSVPGRTSVTGTRVRGCLVVTVSQDLSGDMLDEVRRVALEGILLLPLLGILDSQRTQDVMNKTLSKIAETRAKVFVMDISGVSSMDTAVANQLLKITKATQLMGCETILSGLSPAIARTLVELGVNIGEVRTTATLRDSFELALRAVGVDRKLIATS